MYFWNPSEALPEPKSQSYFLHLRAQGLIYIPLKASQKTPQMLEAVVVVPQKVAVCFWVVRESMLQSWGNQGGGEQYIVLQSARHSVTAPLKYVLKMCEMLTTNSFLKMDPWKQTCLDWAKGFGALETRIYASCVI